MLRVDQILNVSQVAQLLQCSRHSVLSLIKLGELKASKPGRGYIILYKSVMEYLEKSEQLAA